MHRGASIWPAGSVSPPDQGLIQEPALAPRWKSAGGSTPALKSDTGNGFIVVRKALSVGTQSLFGLSDVVVCGFVFVQQREVVATCGGPRGTWARAGWASRLRKHWRHAARTQKPSVSPPHRRTRERAGSGWGSEIQRRSEEEETVKLAAESLTLWLYETHGHRAHSHIVDIFQYVALQQAVCTYSKIHSAGPGVPREARAETPHRLQVVEQFTLWARCLKSNMYRFSAVSQQQERHCICELLRATTVTLQPQKTLQTPSEQPNKGKRISSWTLHLIPASKTACFD